ncbi:MAG TPA: glycosyltransferase family 2 protein [Caulobacteraceae bacterium]|nr:glycosyltransferase family 2 protein [Caulobacteraceae bacterium]
MNGISCIICAYNEGERIESILRVVDAHPALAEVIVVNDGSTDETEACARAHRRIRVVSHQPNRGKTFAMSRGIAAARGEHLMFLDADLEGLGPREIDLLAAPVSARRAEVSISLRRNSLACYRTIGLDFVSGERVIPAWLVRDQVEVMATLPRWGGETFINELVVGANLRIEVVDWPGVSNIRKYRKVGLVQGAMAELRMINDALQVLSPIGLVRQNIGLLRLVNRAPRASPRPIGSRAWR